MRKRVAASPLKISYYNFSLQPPRVNVMRKSPRQLMKEAEIKRASRMPQETGQTQRNAGQTQSASRTSPKRQSPPTRRRTLSEWNKEV